MGRGVPASPALATFVLLGAGGADMACGIFDMDPRVGEIGGLGP